MENKYILITPGERKLLRDSYQMSKSDKAKTWRIQSFLRHTHIDTDTHYSNIICWLLSINCMCVFDTVHMNAC